MGTTKFLELPRVDYQGRPMKSVYVNVDHIICFESEWDGAATRVTVNQLGSDGHGIVTTVLPIEWLVQNLDCDHWSDTLRPWLHQYHQDKLAERERRLRGA